MRYIYVCGSYTWYMYIHVWGSCFHAVHTLTRYIYTRGIHNILMSYIGLLMPYIYMHIYALHIRMRCIYPCGTYTFVCGTDIYAYGPYTFAVCVLIRWYLSGTCICLIVAPAVVRYEYLSGTFTYVIDVHVLVSYDNFSGTFTYVIVIPPQTKFRGGI